jgi:transcriptional regulator GlxA family with amidase domain
MDVLILLTGLGSELAPTPALLDVESRRAYPLLKQALKQGAVIAATCGAAYILADAGILDGKRATISWWLKKEVFQRFPDVKWEPSRILVQDGKIYTSGGGFSGLELLSALLSDLGFSQQERRMRKVMVLPPSRQFQSPYEMTLDAPSSPFEIKLNRLAKELSLSSRTLSRKFLDELQMTPGHNLIFPMQFQSSDILKPYNVFKTLPWTL